MLPSMAHAERLVREQTAAFAGYDHNAVVKEGYFYEMENLSGDLYPVLSPRKNRRLVRTLAKPNGLYSADELCWVDGTGFYYGGVRRGEVSDSPKHFARLGGYIVLFPDKMYYQIDTGQFGSLEASWTGSASITHYAYGASSQEAEEVYQGNAVCAQQALPFEAGEAVFLSGSSQPENNRSAVVREVRDGGKTLLFDNNTFLEQQAQTLTLERRVPDLDVLCENENRLWGGSGRQIFASALGNPFRWNNFEGLATDSFAVCLGSGGPITAAASFLGYAVFFQQDAIHKIYGGKPSNFQAMSSAVSGAASGCGPSMAVAGETLFYLARTGIVSYAGGIPVSIAAPFGPDARFDAAVGGSDGRKYYVSLRQDQLWTLFVYDTRTGLWYKEDHTHALAFARQNGTLFLLDAADNGLYALDGPSASGLPWLAETGDFSDSGPDKTGLLRLLLRLDAPAGSSVKIEIQFDSDGLWRTVQSLTPDKKRSFLLPIIPRRCDHYRIRISGSGDCRIFSLTRQFYRGTHLPASC